MALALVSGLVASPADAAGYPDKQITIVVPLPAGGAADIFARAIGERMRQEWGQPVLVENKDGANTQIGAAYVAKAAPDGYTLLLTPEFTMTIVPSLHQKMHETVKSLTPVSGIAAAPLALIAKPQSRARNVQEFIALAQADPGRAPYAVPGTGSTSHLAVEMLQSQAKMKMTAVAYRGAAPAITDVSAGHVDSMMVAVGLVKELASGGRVRLLGVGSAGRLAGLPDVPAISETLPGYEARVWFGLFAPVGTPSDVITKLNDAVQKLLVDPDFKARYLATNFYEPMTGPPSSMTALIDKEQARWKDVIRAAGLPLD